LNSSAKLFTSVAASEGRMIDKIPFLVIISVDFSTKFLKLSSTCCLARTSFAEAFSSKKGGLQTTKSKFSFVSKFLKSFSSTFKFSLKIEFLKFSEANFTAFSLISMAEILAETFLCANIREIRPVPVPISKIFFAFFTLHIAPSKTPSVPTLKTSLLCCMENC